MLNWQASRATFPVAAATNLSEPWMRDVCFGAHIISGQSLRSHYRCFEVEFCSVTFEGSWHMPFRRIV